MGVTGTHVDKTTRQDLILRLISERDLGTQQDVVGALADENVEVAQATVSRDLAELGVLKVGNRYLALPHDPGSAGIEVVKDPAAGSSREESVVLCPLSVVGRGAVAAGFGAAAGGWAWGSAGGLVGAGEPPRRAVTSSFITRPPGPLPPTRPGRHR